MNSDAITAAPQTDGAITSAPPPVGLDIAKPPRRWPAILIVALGLLLYLSIFLFVFMPESVNPMAIFMTSMWGPMIATLLLAVYWVFGGPGRWPMRLGMLGLAILVVVAAVLAADKSVYFSMFSWGIPATAGLVTLFLCAFSRQPKAVLIGGSLLLGILTLTPWDFLRSHGVTGTFGMDAHWRWAPQADDVATSFDQGKKAETATTEVALTATAADWPGFRGGQRDGVVTAPISLKDWSTPPKELWRRPVGPGWSSLCVVGDRLYTQEQRGDDELVVCYSADTGNRLWAHTDKVRYNDAMSGTGPRATPTFHDGKIYTFGGTGLLNCLDAGSGKLLWTADVKGVTDGKTPPFGFATSPLVSDGRVIVHPGAPAGSRLVAYDAATGKELWKAGNGSANQASYCSPQISTIAGMQQLLVYNSEGLFAQDPATGKELWSYSWINDETAATVIQPMVLADDHIVLGGGRIGIGTRCIKPVRSGDAWTVEDVWRTQFSPGFNDMIHFDGYLYGLEAGRLVCVEAATGERKWKDGRYGTGQLLRVGDRLLILSETGKLAQVSPSPSGWNELIQIPALSDKTWNHPAIAGNRLFVRNGSEMVCFDLK